MSPANRPRLSGFLRQKRWPFGDGDWDQWLADDPEGVEAFYLGEPDPPTFDEADLDDERDRILSGDRFGEDDELDRRSAGLDRPLRSPWVYHLTSMANLEGIVAGAELVAGAGLSIGDLARTEDRAKIKVLTSRHRWMEIRSLVGFYFTPRTPMTWNVVEKPFANTPPKEDLIFLRAKLVSLALYNEFVFTDGHSQSRKTHFYADLADLGVVDFDLMGRCNWDNTTEQRQRQAEFLVVAPVPFRSIDAIGVLGEKTAMSVRELTGGSVRVVTTPRSFFIPS